MWNPRTETKTRKQVGNGGGVSIFTDVYLDGELRASILHTKDSEGKERYMVSLSHKPYKSKYYRSLSKAKDYVIKEEKRYVPLSKASFY